MEALDWRAIVTEAVHRRKAERLTQRDLAALAAVSPPTIIAFERGETSLRLDKALEILRVLGLAVLPEHTSDQDAFVTAARERWHALIANLPIEASARQPLGYTAYDYELAIPHSAKQAPRRFLQTLRAAAVAYSGWPPFWVPTRKSLEPTILDGVIECWLGKPDVERVFDDAAHSDFWRALPTGRLFLQRGYQEDGPDIHEPGVILDLTLPIWRAGEVLLHAASLARCLEEDSGGATLSAPIKLRVSYSGLAGRELISWANPLRRISSPGQYRARTNEVVCKVESSAFEIEQNLPKVVQRWVSALYSRFDFDLSDKFVEQEVDDMRTRARSSSRASLLAARTSD